MNNCESFCDLNGTYEDPKYIPVGAIDISSNIINKLLPQHHHHAIFRVDQTGYLQPLSAFCRFMEVSLGNRCAWAIVEWHLFLSGDKWYQVMLYFGGHEIFFRPWCLKSMTLWQDKADRDLDPTTILLDIFRVDIWSQDHFSGSWWNTKLINPLLRIA